MRESETIYIYLLDEGTDSWRPVEAVRIDKNVYRITSPHIEGESWQFQSGDVVRCREKLSSESDPFLEAYELLRNEISN